MLRRAVAWNATRTIPLSWWGKNFFPNTMPWWNNGDSNKRNYKPEEELLLLTAKRVEAVPWSELWHDDPFVMIWKPHAWPFTGELGVSIKDYDYFVFVNCGLTGPGVMTEKHLPQPIGGQDPTSNNPTKESSIRSSSILPWTLAFTSRLNDQVKMSGLSLNMYGFDKRKQQPHIQSFLYALDRKGIEIIQGANSLFDCLQLPPLSARHHRNNKQYTPEELMFHEIVMRYELGLSTAILEAGYAIAPLLHPRQPKCTHVTKADILEDPNNQNKAMDPNQKCRNFDMWYTQPLEHLYHGRIPTLNETLFFKSSRFVTPEIATLIQYTGQTNFVTEFSENRPAYEMTWFGQITDE